LRNETEKDEREHFRVRFFQKANVVKKSFFDKSEISGTMFHIIIARCTKFEYRLGIKASPATQKNNFETDVVKIF